MDCSVRVVVRFRPVNEREKTEEARGATGARGAGTAFVVREDGRSVEVARPDGQFLVQRGSPDVFSFDRAFGGEAHQADVYEAVAQETIVDVLNGYNGTIFAYGQTGSGKSFTMFGRDIETDERGIIPRACSQLFKRINEDKEGTEFTIKCSFMEIYKERVRDLLNPKSVNLKVHETPTRGVWVEDLTEEFVATEDDVLELLRLGDKFRAVTPTRMNDASSRSHSLFVLTLHQRMPDGSTKTGRLNLADLAGSEKVSKTGAKGNTLEEAKNINKSLAALGNCINALTTKGKSHVPYRDSKLTHILKESLGGNSKTTLVCTCSPHEFNAEETVSTLRFGQRVKTIKNSVQVNKQRSVEELNEIIAVLRKEVKALKRYALFLESEMRKLKGNDWAPPSVIPRTVPASPAARSGGPAASPYKPSTPSSARSMGGAGTPSRASLMGANRRESEDMDDPSSLGVSDMLDPVRVAEMRVEMKKLLMASSVQIEQLQDDLKGVQEEEYQNKEKISRLKHELNERETEKERLVREVENKDMELGSQVRRLHYELKQALLDVENATAQLKGVNDENEDLKQELTASKDELDRLIRGRESLVDELSKILQPEQAQALNLEEMRMDPAEREAKQAQAKEQAEKREADEWRKKEELYVKKAAHSALRIEEMEREMDELRQKARQTEQALDEEKRRAAQRERELKRQVELMSEAEEIARRRGAATTMKVVKPIRATIKEQLFQRKSSMIKRRELAGVVLKEGWLTKEGGLVRNWKKRWFVLQDGNLYYYENANKATGKGCVLLDGCVVTPAEGETKKKNAFAIYHDSRRTFYLQAASDKELGEWTEALTEAINDHTASRESSLSGASAGGDKSE